MLFVSSLFKISRKVVFADFFNHTRLLFLFIPQNFFSSRGNPSFHKRFSLFRFVQIVKDQLRFTYKSTEPSILLQTLNSVFFYCAFFSNYPDLTDKSEHHFLNLKHLRTLQKNSAKRLYS